MNFRAYAKINIGLRIFGKRPDGYHDIETIFHQIDCYDELSFESAETVRLTTSSSEIPLDATNLCVRAAQLFRKQTGHPEGIEIGLKKRIPVGAGLGGGSSDAAAVLVALNELWKTGMALTELESLASQLGSDVPFFIRGGTAAGSSRGEVLEHFDLSIPFWILTVTPPIQLSTEWAYSNVHLEAKTNVKPLRMLVEQNMADLREVHTDIRNDFEELVFQKYPEIGGLKEKLEGAGAIFVQLSGSGSSIFGFYRLEAAAQTAIAELGSTYATSLTGPDFKPIQVS